MLSFIKRHSVSLAKGQSRTGFYPATRRNNSNLCCTSTASAISQIKILSKQRKSGKTCTCANFRERGPRNCHFLWWLKILSIFSLLFSSESTIHRKPWSDAQNCAIPPLLEHHFLWAAHPKALRARICPGKGHVYKTVVSFMTIHRTGRWMSPVKTQ